jgi:4-hydroxybenzoate polyprenyltransferase
MLVDRCEVETKPMLEESPGREVRPAERPTAGPVLVVDLDGTLLKTDLLLESVLVLLKQKPLCLFLLPVWLMKGKAYLKQQIARRVELDVSVLPYRSDLIEYLKGQRNGERLIVLATASDMRPAQQVAEYLKVFDRVYASDGITNLAGKSKRNRLVEVFGEKAFDYAGNDWHDLQVWSAARKAIVVAASRVVSLRVAQVAQVDRVFEKQRRGLLAYLRPLRIRHSLKNILVFVPLLAAQRLLEVPLLEKAILAFVAFQCFASGGYLLNDLFDLHADRHHPHKRLRPFAAGDLPLSYGLFMIPALVALGCVISLLVSPLLLAILLIYLALAAMYSFYVRKVVLLDVIVLAALYTIRIMAGSAAVSIWPSHWLLAISTFLFFSLALVKRYGELMIMRRIDGNGATARGYELDDGELLAAMGVASGYLAVLVLALYINSDKAQVLYGRYELIWFLCPLLFYWISYVWLIAHRGKMPDDPVVFAVSDRTSQIVALLMVAITLVAL